jgi:hypothetical protein
MKRFLALTGFFALIGFGWGSGLGIGSPVAAADLRLPIAIARVQPVVILCYACIRDGIYADISLIDHLEANPDIDDGIKGPPILAARADVHRLRNLLGPVTQRGTMPCCYSRRPLYIR